jgi:hypothetical protein
VPDVIRINYGAPVTTGSTLTFPYPANRSGNDYLQGYGAIFYPRVLQNTYVQNVDFTLAYGATSVVLTWNNPITIPYGQTSYTDNHNLSGDRFVVGLELPRIIDAATVIWPPPDSNDVLTFT